MGPDVDIIIENHSQLDALSAIQIARATEKYNIFFFEEPNTPSPKTARYIRDNINIPIANGERIFGRWQYAPYFEDMSIQIAQPDLSLIHISSMSLCGGAGASRGSCGTYTCGLLAIGLKHNVPLDEELKNPELQDIGAAKFQEFRDRYLERMGSTLCPELQKQVVEDFLS